MCDITRVLKLRYIVDTKPLVLTSGTKTGNESANKRKNTAGYGDES